VRLVLLAALTLPACNQWCVGDASGPSCSSQWSRSRLVAHSRDKWAQDLAPWDDATWIFEGSETDGVEWAFDATDGVIVLGMPEANRVVVREVTEFGPGTVLAEFTGNGGFGSSVAMGDVDGDGVWDLWVGAEETSLFQGALYLYLDAEAESRDQDAADLELRGFTPGDRFGSTVVACGDVSGDGLGDWLVSAPRFSQPSVGALAAESVANLAGAVFLLESERLAGASGVTLPGDVGPAWWGASAGAGLGASAVCSHDVSGDQVPDVILGAPWQDDQAGAVYVIGSTAASAMVGPEAGMVLQGGEEDWLGAALAVGNLLDEPGRTADLLVGAPGYKTGRGQAVLYSGADLATSSAPAPHAAFSGDPSREPRDHVGRAVAVGDIDGDGLADAVVGAPDRKASRVLDAGQISIFRGTDRADWTTAEVVGSDEGGTANSVLTGSAPFQHVGLHLLLRDLDGDDRLDLLFPTRRRP
jgi:hypothetical protein